MACFYLGPDQQFIVDMAYETTPKFVRAHYANITTGVNGGTLYFLKMLYEFWGFCVNGGNDLLRPGGFATIGGTLAPNYLRMAPRFESGSAVLLASGSDGSTTYGNQIFTAPSVNWTSGSKVGLHIVTWKSSSSSTDDSIYRIVSIIDSSSVVVDTTTGGTAMSASFCEPRFTSRSNINFRVVDFAAASALPGFAVNDYMILQFNASAVNAGQANSQARIRLAAGGSTITQGNIALSASGSWNGTSFSDLGPESPPDVTSQGLSTLTPYEWFHGTNGDNYFSLFADQAGVINHAIGTLSVTAGNVANLRGGSYFHIEVPRRLFPANVDPNPICFVNSGKTGMDISTFTTNEQYGSGWVMHCPNDNATVRRFNLVARNLGGSNNTGLYLGTTNSTQGSVSNERYRQSFYNQHTRKFMIQDLVLTHRHSTTSYTMGRAQLRLAVFVTGPLQLGTKIGARGQWQSVQSGIMWPWDNVNLPVSMWPYSMI